MQRDRQHGGGRTVPRNRQAVVVLWPKVRKQEERKDVGKALSADEETRLLDTAAKNIRWMIAAAIVRIALLTGMRSGEITRLMWGQVDLDKQTITVGRAKTSSGTGRQIPMNGDLFAVLSTHASWTACCIMAVCLSAVLGVGAPSWQRPRRQRANDRTWNCHGWREKYMGNRKRRGYETEAGA
jgi:integrase